MGCHTTVWTFLAGVNAEIRRGSRHGGSSPSILTFFQCSTILDIVFWKIEILEKCQIFKFPKQTQRFENAHPWCCKFLQEMDLKIPDLGSTPQLQIRSNSHSHDLLTYMGRWISKSQYERCQFQSNSLKLLSCYEASRSKTLLVDLNPKGAESGKPGQAWACPCGAKPETSEGPPLCGSRRQGQTRDH